MTELMNFAPRPSVAFAEAFAGLLDAAIERDETAKTAAWQSDPLYMRPAIGGGRLGNDCLRAIAFEYHRTQKDPGREFSGRLYRIFARGHWSEGKMAEYIRSAGFTLLTEAAGGRQFRYDICKYPDTGKGRIKGMIDGVITAGPSHITAATGNFQMDYPALWEAKELGAKGWNKLVKLGVRGYEGDYFPQIQMGMFYLGLTDNPALFTAKNADTQEIYAELVAADQIAIQNASDKGAKVVATADPFEMPRVTSTPTDFRCKFCDYAQTCWAETRTVVQTAQAQTWSFGKPANAA